MFCDQSILRLNAGNGGNGCVSFRRAKYVPKGGPDGGDGGRGGDIFFTVNSALNSLIHLETYKQFTAEKGTMGSGQRKHGKDGQDLLLEVPLGTIVREISRDKKGKIIEKEKKEIADLSSPEMRLLIAKGGRGGYGNAHFVSSVRQAPKFAELGEEGEELEVELELKLVADIGIIGVPSVGKSTLISVISNAKPKIAEYPFTTLVPHLGVVQIDKKKDYVVADIPGLIEKAHKGKGLGIQFLKHVQRCRLLVHLIEPIQPDLSYHRSKSNGPVNNFQLINNELKAFSEDLAHKHQIVVINKADLISDEEQAELIKKLKKTIGRDKKFVLYPKPISAATTAGVDTLKKFLFQQLEKVPKRVPASTDQEPETSHILYRPHLENPKYFSVEKIASGQFHVRGKRIEQIANMTDFDNREAAMRVYDVLKKMGISKELKKIGAKDGDRVTIGKQEIEFQAEI